MARLGAGHKLARHLGISDKAAQKLVDAGYGVPKKIKGVSKRRLRDDAGLTQKEADGAKARWK